MRKRPKQYVLCVQNAGYLVSLEKRKVYETLPDLQARRGDMVRVIDESGEDYLYPKALFAPINLPKEIEEALLAAA